MRRQLHLCCSKTKTTKGDKAPRGRRYPEGEYRFAFSQTQKGAEHGLSESFLNRMIFQGMSEKDILEAGFN